MTTTQLFGGVSAPCITAELTKIVTPLQLIAEALAEKLNGKEREVFFSICESLTLVNRRLTGLINDLTELSKSGASESAAGSKIRLIAVAKGIEVLSSDLRKAADSVAKDDNLAELGASLLHLASSASSLIEVKGLETSKNLAQAKPTANPPENSISTALSTIRSKSKAFIKNNWKTPSAELELKPEDGRRFAVLFHSYGLTDASFTRSDGQILLTSVKLSTERGLPLPFWAKLENAGLIKRGAESKATFVIYEFTPAAKSFFHEGLKHTV